VCAEQPLFLHTTHAVCYACQGSTQCPAPLTPLPPISDTPHTQHTCTVYRPVAATEQAGDMKMILVGHPTGNQAGDMKMLQV